jgi:hypothetical protein
MAYTKTTWVNGSVPNTGLETDPSLATGISADNLNKMEQGIEDAQAGGGDVASFGFKTIDPGGGADYLTLDEAYTDNEFKLYMVAGVHNVSTNLPVIPIGGTLHLKGAGRNLTTVHYTGTGYYLGKPAENVDTANKFPTGGTYTLGGSYNNTISLTGLTFSGGDTSIEDLWSVGSVLAFSSDINAGCAEITAISGIGSTGSVTFARIPRDLLDDSNFGQADWLWSINSIDFVAEDFTITSTASANAALKQDSGSLGSFRTVITNVGTTKNLSFSGDSNVSWNTYMLNCNLNGYEQPGALGQVDYCSFGTLFGRVAKYNGDVQFSNCWIGSCAVGDSPWDNLYCRFNDCNFGFDISAHATFGKSAAISAKLYNCMDTTGFFTQPA